MFKKSKYNNKGSALVFAMILIANAVAIVSSVVFLVVIQNKSSGALYLTTVASQEADSGLEYIINEIIDNGDSDGDGLYEKEINDLNLCDGNGADADVDSSSGECKLIDPDVEVYFLDEDKNILKSSSFSGEDIKYIKVIGNAKKGSNKVSRALRANFL